MPRKREPKYPPGVLRPKRANAPGAGRKTMYTKAMAAQICERLASGESLRHICKTEGMPDESKVRVWVINDRQGFSKMYREARDMGLDTLADEVLEIANTPEFGLTVTTDEDGKRKEVHGDMIAHRRLKFDARRWYLSKLAPKKYGEKLENILRGDPDAPVTFVISPADAKL